MINIKTILDRLSKYSSGSRSRVRQKGDTFYFFGDFDDLDTRISGREKDNFDKKISILKEKINKAGNVRIIIGISRYNFFRLHEIAQYCSGFFGPEINLDWIKFRLFPISKIIENFNNYIKEIKSHLPAYIKFEMYDKQLNEILRKFRDMALENVDSDPELARLLGILTENAFVGPRVMVIDPHHRCNTNCTHCWVHTPGVKHSDEFLDMTFPIDRFRKMIDDAAEMKVQTIILQGDGEPLLHPDSMEMLTYAKKKGIEARFFTNGILLNEKIAEKIVEIGVDEIYCSFPAGSRETYKIINPIQKPKTYDKVVNNLKRLMELKKKAGSDKPRVIVTHVIHTQNHHELVKMARDDVYEKVDAARFYLIRLDEMNTFLQLSQEEITTIEKQIPEVEKILSKGGVEFVDNIKFQLHNYNKKDGSWSKDVFLKKGCPIGWYFNLVPAKGDISYCCHLRTVGDLSTDSYKEIWNSSSYRRWRIQGKYMKDNMDVKFQNDQPLYDEHCTHCDNHQQLLEIYNTLEKYDLAKYY